MTIRIFNPEHDIALASGQERFTAPHAGRQLRSDLSFLPALWSEDGDVVVVDDIDAAGTLYAKCRSARKPTVEFCTFEQLPKLMEDVKDEEVHVEPWGWDAAIRFQFAKAGVEKSLLPDRKVIDEVRRLSNRKITVELLPELRRGIESDTCGEAVYIADYDDFTALLLKRKNLVVKAPWSSSGRGIRYFMEGTDAPTTRDNANSWVRNVIAQQGGVMIEPLYAKVKDFALEFQSGDDGRIMYKGLSLFNTLKAAYTGNLLATENEKREIVSQYVKLNLLDDVIQRLENLLSACLKDITDSLPNICLGVDMMIVAKEDGEGFLLHPCVEVNLRRTMGHVALALSPANNENMSMMAVTYEGKKYRLKIKRKQ